MTIEIEDPKLMAEMRAHASALRAGYGQRDALFDKYLEMYLLDWRKKNNRKLKHMQVTASPDFRNQVQGAVRLMVATDPQVNVKRTEKTKSSNVEAVEEFLNSTLYQSGRLAGEPVHYPMITAGLLYDEMHAAITPTLDMLKYAQEAEKKAGDDRARAYAKAQRYRWEEISEATKFLVEPWSPVGGYPEFGTTGLTAYYRVTEVTAGEVIDRFGALPGKASNLTRQTRVNLHTFYDQVYTAIWIDQGDLLLRPHGLPRIPVVVQILNGSRMFAKPEDQRQPFGYTLYKSNLWTAQNLALTAIYTAVLNYAWSPTKIYTPGIEGSRIEINNDEDLITLHPGDRLDYVQNKGTIDPSMQQALTLANDLGSQSTIYPQALGAAPERVATYSQIALLSQAGRLPLIGPQRRGGWAFSSICETILAFMRDEPDYRAGTGLSVSDIPRGVEVNVKLDVSLPQDKLQQANIIQILTDPNNPKVSTGWALENILNISNPEQMRREIWNEQAAEQYYRQQLAQLLQAAAQAQQQANQPQGPQPGQGMPPQGPGGPVSQGGPMPPESMGGPQQPGAPMQGGLPQAQAGSVPGVGRILAGQNPGEPTRGNLTGSTPGGPGV